MKATTREFRDKLYAASPWGDNSFLTDSWRAGVYAAINDQPDTSCPYSTGPLSSGPRDAWLRGYRHAVNALDAFDGQ
jgi:ribosome modulation factor